MTKEEAKQFGLSLLQGIADRNTDEYAENVRFAIEALSQPSLPSNLDEAATMHFKDVLERKTKTGLETPNMTSFKAGVEWMAAQGVTFASMVDFDDDYYLDCAEDESDAIKKLGLKVMDKAIVQIRKA